LSIEEGAVGWWKGEGGDIVGDLPVDRILGAMRGIAERATAAGKRKPTLPAMLAIAAAAAAHRPEVLISDPQEVPERPVARVLMRDGTWIEGDRSQPDAEVVSALWDQFRRVAVDYKDTELERLPTLSELLASLAFVLRVEGRKYLESPPRTKDIDRILLEQQPD
jgi:hypothetical protein